MIKFDTMLLRTIIKVVLVSSAGTLFGQSQGSRCGTVEWDKFLAATVAGHTESRQMAGDPVHTHQHGLKSTDPMIIPVVVHVIYRLPEQNISNEQIYSQIEALNRDFNKLNWDTMNVPVIWRNLIANCGIRFELANRDPQGNMTNGITRRNTVIQDIASVTGNAHFSTAKGGTDIWDRNSYLNIWVCEIAGDLYGFASYPGSPAASDGLVINFTSFGTTGTAEFPTDDGRTVTHEAGHWLNLLHIWGDAVCGDDLIGDTPEQKEANFDCQTFPHITCSNGPAGDMFMNYMDYSDDNCLNMFTEGQKARMLATLHTNRVSLLSSEGYNGMSERIGKNRPGTLVIPNPVHSSFVLSPIVTGSALTGTIIAADGRAVHQFHSAPADGTLTVDLPALPNGLYLILLKGDDLYSVHSFQVLNH